jgi:ATP-binding cassette subfamily F protein 3
MEDASTGYGEEPVLRRLSLTISDDDRIGLLGANGNGKSTFAKRVTGRLKEHSGSISRSSGTGKLQRTSPVNSRRAGQSSRHR